MKFRTVPVWIVLLCFTWEAHAACEAGGFRLHADFAGGALGRCQTLSETSVHLDIAPEGEPINPSPWYAFHVSGQGELLVQIHYGTFKHRYHPKVSVDGKSWTRLADSALHVEDTIAELTLEVGPSGLYVAAQEVITSEWYENWLQELQQRHSHLVLEQFGTSMGGKPLWAASTNPDAENAVILVGRQHPPEVTGALAMVSFVTHLLEMQAEGFHQDTNVVFAPLLNPDGVDAGHWRHNLGGVDLNRDWGEFAQPETQAALALIDRIAEKAKVRLFLDFHSTRRDVLYTQMTRESLSALSVAFRWLDEMSQRLDDCVASWAGSDSRQCVPSVALAYDETSPPGFATHWLAEAARLGVHDYEHARRLTSDLTTSKNYMHRRFGVPAITFEVGDETDRERIELIGRAFADAMVTVLYPYGTPAN